MEYEEAKKQLLARLRSSTEADHDAKVYLEKWGFDEKAAHVSINDMIADIEAGGPAGRRRVEYFIVTEYDREINEGIRQSLGGELSLPRKG